MWPTAEKAITCQPWSGVKGWTLTAKQIGMESRNRWRGIIWIFFKSWRRTALPSQIIERELGLNVKPSMDKFGGERGSLPKHKILRSMWHETKALNVEYLRCNGHQNFKRSLCEMVAPKRSLTNPTEEQRLNGMLVQGAQALRNWTYQPWSHKLKTTISTWFSR